LVPSGGGQDDSATIADKSLCLSLEIFGFALGTAIAIRLPEHSFVRFTGL
jgi:hypothetical protein